METLTKLTMEHGESLSLLWEDIRVGSLLQSLVDDVLSNGCDRLFNGRL